MRAVHAFCPCSPRAFARTKGGWAQWRNGTDRNAQVSITKWALSLRNRPAHKNDPYGKPAASVVVGQMEKEQARARESMLSKLVAKFANHISDAKVHNTILAFREHVPTPTMNDLAQLDDVLSAYVKRLVQKDESKRRLMAKTLSAANLSARVESQIKEQGSGPAASPGELMAAGQTSSRVSASVSRQGDRTPAGSARSEGSRLYRDVRKDEWYAIQLDQAARLEVEDRKKLEGKKKEAALTYAILKQQELELDNVAKLHKEEQREEGRKQKAVQKVWRDKEKARKAELEVWRRQEKLRAESAKEELMDNYRATVAKEAEKENEEVMKIRALIVRDKAEAEAKKAAGAAAAQAVKELNAAEEARKKVAQRLQRDKDEREMKKYQDMLEARQRAREEEEEARLARLAAQAAVAQQRFDQAETDAEADERRAKEVQRQRQARQDAAAAAMVAQKKKEQKATMAYVQMQQRAHVEQDALVLQANRREAALNKIEFEKALKRDDERRNAVRAKNLAYGKSIQRQVAEDQSYLASGAGERGMTKFEKQYNRDAISNVRRFAQRHYRFHSQGPETKSDAVLCRSLRKKRALEDQKMAVSQPE